MSILIRGMDMPKGCFSCALNRHLNPDEDECIVTGNCFDSTLNTVTHRRMNCPLVELPPHGRLIDADDLDNHILGHVDTRYCPTIIPAEEGEG